MGLLSELLPPFMKLALGYARIAPVFYLLPFLNGNLLGGPLVKNTLIVVVAMGMGALTPQVLPDSIGVELLAQAIAEALIGLGLGVLLALPFWLAHAMGSIIDNQRGATISNTMDPVNGVETSEMANFFNLLIGVVFLQAGGMLWMLDCLEASYRLFPVAGRVTLNLPEIWGVLDHLVARGLILAAPVVACLFLIEVALGVLSRFSQQLNAFSVAMTVKSAVAFMILLVYCVPAMRELAIVRGDVASMFKLLQVVS